MATVTAQIGTDNFTGTGGAGDTSISNDTINSADGTANAGDVWIGGPDGYFKSHHNRRQYRPVRCFL